MRNSARYDRHDARRPATGARAPRGRSHRGEIQPLPDFASADLRLDSLDAVTFGLRVGFTLRDGSELVVRAEYYSQTGDSHPQDAVGAQRAYDLYPTLYASIVQVEYHFVPQQLFSKWSR